MRIVPTLSAWLPLHQNLAARLVHWLGWFMFCFALAVPLGWARVEAFGLSWTGAHLAWLALGIVLVRLDGSWGLIPTALLAPIVFSAEALSHLPMSQGGGIALGVMVVRFALVIGAHVGLEKKTHGVDLGGPLLFVTEPVYLLARDLLVLGRRDELRRALVAQGVSAPALPGAPAAG